MLDLQRKTSNRSMECHKRFCSTYMQLSRLQSLKRVSFLASISLSNINNQLHHQLLVEDNRLQKLGDITSLSFANARVKGHQKMHDY